MILFNLIYVCLSVSTKKFVHHTLVIKYSEEKKKLEVGEKNEYLLAFHLLNGYQYLPPVQPSTTTRTQYESFF